MTKRYDKDFKKMIVELHLSGIPVKQLAAEYGLKEVTIYSWLKLHTPSETTGVTEVELLELKKKMAKLEEENTILKKALTIFADK